MLWVLICTVHLYRTWYEHTIKCTLQIRTHNTVQSFGQFGWVFVYELVVVGSSPVAATSTSDFAPVSSKDFLSIRAIKVCGFALKPVRDMIRTYNQEQRWKEKFRFWFYAEWILRTVFRTLLKIFYISIGCEVLKGCVVLRSTPFPSHCER